MTRAFVLAGGGNLGAVQVGMLQALRQRGIVPDLLIGTSVGALHAAYLAGHGWTADALDGLARIWTRLRRKDVFPFDPVRHILAVTGRRPSLCRNDALRWLVGANLPYRQLQQAAIPVHLVATNLLTGQEVLLSAGDAIDAVLASAAVPAVLPPVRFANTVLCDGCVSDNAGLSPAVALGADEIYVIPAGHACALTQPPAGALAAALHTVSLLTQQRLALEVSYLADQADLHVLPPLCPVSVSPIDFSRAATLIARAYQTTRTWLAEGGDQLPHPERFLSLHDHASAPDAPHVGTTPTATDAPDPAT